jgi:RHS repeat-associated protein
LIFLPYGNSLNKNETVANPWQYASGYYDATTSLYKFGTRYYDPQTGRWTQKDPVGGSIGKIGSGNPYVYGGNVPTMQVDPSGRLGGYLGILDTFLGCINIPPLLAAAYIGGAIGLLGGLCASAPGIGCLSVAPILQIVGAVIGVPPIAACYGGTNCQDSF